MVLLIVAACIALQIFLSLKKVTPFLSLLIVAIIASLCLGQTPSEMLKSLQLGVANTLGGLVLIIILGASLGKILEISGAAEQIANTLVRVIGEKHIQWAVLLTGFMIGIPLYYNAGFVILIPLIYSLSKRLSINILYIAIPMAAALSATHCFLPPHPGPVVLVNAFGADMGKTLIYGFISAIPAVIIAGPILGKTFKHKAFVLNNLFSSKEPAPHKIMPSPLASFSMALAPVLLISLGVISSLLLPQESPIAVFLQLIGDSTIALLITILGAMIYLGIVHKRETEEQMKWVNEAVSGISVIVLIITSGGIFKQVLQDSGTADYIASFATEWAMPPLIFAWCITALLRVTIGSATVAGLTAAGIVSPLLSQTGVSPELLTLAVGAGSVFGSHINDSGFWMFKEFFGLSLKDTFLSWSLMEVIISVVGILMVLVLNQWI